MEVCVDNIQSVHNAVEGGAVRLELCDALHVGGLTPSVELMRMARRIVPENFKIFVMIRPRPGDDFLYNEDELSKMVEEVEKFKKEGADGFVFGCLKEDRTVDEKACQVLLREAGKLPCTFHRAFDQVPNPVKSLELLEKLGFARVLTSGQEKTALLGKVLIQKLIQHCEDENFNIIVLPGSGINDSNLEEILLCTKAKEYHGSAKGQAKNAEETITDAETVRKMVEIGRRILG